MDKLTPKNQQIISFEDKEIRSIEHDGELWYVVVDVINVVTESKNPKGYLRDMRRRDEGLAEVWDNITLPLPIKTKGGTQKLTCSNREGIFRVLQSVTSKKLEPFKLWLAKVGSERIDEINNPALAAERARQYYQALGYSDEWIATRLESIKVRGQLTDEWKDRGVKEGVEYSILTAEISKATFGLLPSQHKSLKNLKKENLRDHMTNLELIFTMLGEEVTRQTAQDDDAQGFEENKEAAQKGGKAAGDARKVVEKNTGQKVISSSNFKKQIEEAKTKKQIDTSSEEES
ncbi:BRO family protein [Aureispira sp. CCB-QB1]|uniref:BRO family protein n=1 Tax=Aureispira sp. CCB-QB1 TaxID=1313421 RepID=UPI0007C87628|nr:BRO family protein [Aureispira sp. CCB-QB1]